MTASPNRRRLIRFSVLAFAAILALALGAAAFLSSNAGRRLVLDAISGGLAASRTMQLRYEAVGGDWPRTLVLEGVTLSDGAGVWLSARRATLAWRPLALLGGRLSVARFDLVRPVIHRMPEGAPDVEDEAATLELALPDLPVGLVIEQIALIEARFTGPPEAGFNAGGSLVLTKNAARLALNLQRTDDVGEALRLEAQFDQARRELALDLDVTGVAGGLVAALAAWPDMPAFHVTAKGEGPPEAWRFALEGEAETLGALDVDGQLAWTDTVILGYGGHYAPGSAFDDIWRDFLGDELAFEGGFAHEESGNRLHLKADGAGVALAFGASEAARGRMGRGSEPALSGTVHLETRVPVVFAEDDVTLGPIALDAKITGTRQAPEARVAVSLEQFAVDDFMFEAFEGGLQVSRDGQGADPLVVVVGSGRSGTIAYQNDGAITPLATQAAWNLDGRVHDDGTIDVQRMTLTMETLAIEVAGTLADGLGTLGFVLTGTDFAPLSPVAETDLAGGGALNGTVTLNPDDTLVEFSGRLDDPVVEGVRLTALLGPGADVEGRVRLPDAGAAVIETAHARGDSGFVVEAEGQVETPVDFTANLRGDLAGLAGLAGVEASGAYQASAKFGGTWLRPILAIHLDADDAALEGYALGTLTLSLTPDQGPDLPGQAGIRSEGPLGRIDIAARLSRPADGAIILERLSGEILGGTLDGTLSLPPDGGAARGDIALAFPSIAPVVHALTKSAGPTMGRARVDVTLRDGVTAPVLAVRLRGEGVRIPTEAISLETLDGKLTMQESGFIDAALIANDGVLPLGLAPLQFGRLSASVKGTGETLVLTADGEALSDGTGHLRLEGQLSGGGDRRRLRVTQFEGLLWQTPLGLEAPLTVSFAPYGPSIDPVRLNVGAGAIELDMQSFAKGFRLDASVERLPVPLVGAVLGTTWQRGALDGALNVDTSGARPSGQARLDMIDAVLGAGDRGQQPPLAVQARADWDGRALALTADAEQDGTAPFHLSARLPLAASADAGPPRFAADGPVVIDAAWQGRLGTLWALVPVDTHRLDGTGALDLTVRGTFGEPMVSGALEITDGSYENLETATRFTDLALTLNATTRQARLNVTGSDGNGGQLTGLGTVMLSPTEQFPLRAELTLAKLRVIGLDDIAMRASGMLALGGNLAGMTLSGDLTVDEVEARIPDRIPPTVEVLPVEYKGYREAWGEKPPENGTATPIALDLRATIPGQAYLRGRGLVSEWRGGLAIGGTIDVPEVVGEIGLVRGTLGFAGRSFDLTRGLVSFAGGTEIDPDLEVIAERRVDDTDIFIAVRGPTSALSVEIGARPPLPPDEAMARLLFGKPANDLSPFELLEVARAVATLSGVGPTAGGLDILERTRRALGFDVLSVDIGEPSTEVDSLASGTTITAGRYITDRIYLGLKQGAQAGSSTVHLEAEIFPNVTLDSEVGPESETSVGINWKWNY